MREIVIEGELENFKDWLKKTGSSEPVPFTYQSNLTNCILDFAVTAALYSFRRATAVPSRTFYQ